MILIAVIVKFSAEIKGIGDGRNSSEKTCRSPADGSAGYAVVTDVGAAVDAGGDQIRRKVQQGGKRQIDTVLWCTPDLIGLYRMAVTDLLNLQFLMDGNAVALGCLFNGRGCYVYLS